MFFININGGSLSTPLTKERVRKSEGSRSQGFKDSSGSLGIFFQNLEAKDSLHSAVSLASPPPFIPNS
ncbi:MAG TPA: hypothetical protein PK263_06890 [bacterium]|nr:hypothetical protein [bacterium]